MAKKGQAQLQVEVTNDEEWEKLLQREGLIVVDIYSDWCGPCNAMLNNLRKLKLEVGGDYLHIAQAKCNDITQLARFRNKSQPTWMFISNRNVLQLIFGADSPKLLQLIIEELEKEAQIRNGLQERVGWSITTLSPEEQEQDNIKKAKEEEACRLVEEKIKQALYDRRMAVAQIVLQTVPKNGIIIVMPQARDMVKTTLAELWDQSGLAITLTERPTFTEAMLEELLYFTDFRFSDMDVSELLGSSCIAYFLKTTDSEYDGDIDELVKKFIYGEMKEPPGSPESPAQLLKGYVVITKEIKSSTDLKSKTTLNDSKSNVPSKLQMQSSTLLHSKEMLDNMQSFSHIVEEETIEVTGIWVPPNSLVRATAIKLLFPKIYDPVALPDPVPIPPHVAIAFDAVKRREVLGAMRNYENEVMHYGFFSDDKPGQAKLLAKTLKKFDKTKDKSPTVRLVIQLSRKKSEALCVLSQLNPTYISHNTVVGEEDCKYFFPEGYDEVTAEEEVAVAEPVKRKDSVADEVDEEEVDEEDKATSPMPE